MNWRSLAPSVFIAFATFLTFMPALNNRLLGWDDKQTLLDNPYVHGLTGENVSWMFSHYFMGHYQPLALLTFAVDYEIWGPEPFGFHLTNVLLHSLNAALFYLLCTRLLQHAVPRWRYPHPAAPWGAMAAALLFALHPLRVESVAWATERRDVLSASFYLAAVLAYLIAHERREEGKSARGWMAMVAGAAMLSLMARMIAVTLVPILLVLDIYPLRRWTPGTTPRKLLLLLLEKMPLLLLSVIMMVVAIQAQAQEGAWAGAEPHGLTLRLKAALFSLAFYLWKMMLPIHLSPLYQMPLHADEISSSLAVAGVLVLLSGPLLAIWQRRWGAVTSAWACYVILLAPTLGLFQVWPQIAADRYTYLATMGWTICLAGFLLRLVERLQPAKGSLITCIVTAALCTPLALLTWRQTKVWLNDETLWQRVLELQPDTALALANLGVEYLAQGRLTEAEQCTGRAAALRPANPRFRANYALALARQGNFAAAEHEVRRALALWPENAEARAILANVLRKQNRLDEAIQEYRSAAAIEPAQSELQRRLAETLLEASRASEAVRVLEQAVVTNASDARLWDLLAQAKLAPETTSPPAEAVRAAQQAVELTGGRVPEYLDTLARAQHRAGNPLAAETARRACAIAGQMGNAVLLSRCQETLQQLEETAPR